MNDLITVGCAITGAVVLASVAVLSVVLAKIGRPPRCKMCGNRITLNEYSGDSQCELCGETYQDL